MRWYYTTLALFVINICSGRKHYSRNTNCINRPLLQRMTLLLISIAPVILCIFGAGGWFTTYGIAVSNPQHVVKVGTGQSWALCGQLNIVDLSKKRICSWKTKPLSQAGRQFQILALIRLNRVFSASSSICPPFWVTLFRCYTTSMSV